MGKFIDKRYLFEVALRYIEKGYSYEQLSDGDSLYSVSEEEKNLCLDYYDAIKEKGTNWAYEQLNLEND